MKTKYNIKDIVWIHISEPSLVKGRIVEIINLEHLEEGHSPDNELYIVEIKTGIEDIYEVRNFNQISPDATGPINFFRNRPNELLEGSRFFKKIGMPLPINTAEISSDNVLPLTKKKPTKRRYYKSKKND